MKILTRKKLIVSMIVLLGVVTSSLTMAHFQKHQPNFEKLATELVLSEDQKTQFIEVMNAQHEKRKALRNENREAKKEAMKQYKEETLSALETVLNETQLAEFNTHMEKRKQKRQNKMKEKKSNE